MASSPEIHQRSEEQKQAPVAAVEVDEAVEPRTPEVSVVLPAHNEAEVVGPVALSFLRAALEAGWEAEVIVVDDGSHDETQGATLRAAGGDPRIRVVRHEVCRGYGRALRTGFEAARGRWIFFTDGDGQFSCDALPGFLTAAREGEGELIVGYRTPRRDPPARRALGWSWSRLVQSAFGVRARDINCAYKLMRREDVECMALTSQGALINAEIFHKARRQGLRLHERPVPHLARTTGSATGARPEVIKRALLELCRYRLRTLWR